VGVGGDRARLFVKVADEVEARAAADRIHEVHATAAGEHEQVAHALIGHEVDNVIRKFDHSAPVPAREGGVARATTGESVKRDTSASTSAMDFFALFQGRGNKTARTPARRAPSTWVGLSSTRRSTLPCRRKNVSLLES